MDASDNDRTWFGGGALFQKRAGLASIAAPFKGLIKVDNLFSNACCVLFLRTLPCFCALDLL